MTEGFDELFTGSRLKLPSRSSCSRMSPVSGDLPQQALHTGADRPRPLQRLTSQCASMRYARCNQSCADAPGERAQTAATTRSPRRPGLRCERHGRMGNASRDLAGKRGRRLYGPIRVNRFRPLLIENRFEQMRHQRRGQVLSAECGCWPVVDQVWCRASSHHPNAMAQQNVLIRSPGHRFRSSFSRRVGV